MKLAIVLTLLIATSACGQQTPIPVATRSEVKSTFLDMVACRDKEFCIAGWTYAAAYTTDMISTHAWIEGCPRCVENGGLFNGSRSTAKISLAWSAVFAGNLILAHIARNHERNRWIRAAWPSGLILGAATHARAAAHNYQGLSDGFYR